jgi:hypothetical protein
MGRKLLRLGKYVLAALVVLVLAAGDLYLLATWKFNPPPPASDFSAPTSALEAQRQDLTQFRRLLDMDRSFAREARAQAHRRIAALKKSDTILPGPHFRVTLMEIVALSDNAHTRLYSGPGALPNVLPVRVALFSDGLYVMRAKGEATALLGGRVVSVDGKPVESVLARLAALRGGPPNWRRLNASFYVMVQDILYGVGIAPEAARSSWTVVMPDGQTRTQVLHAYRLEESEELPDLVRLFSSEPLKGAPGGNIYQAGRELPLALRDFDRIFRRVRLPGICAMYVQLKANEDQNGESISDFLKATSADMRANPPCAVIMDMRFNGGGDYTNAYRFANDLPELVRNGGPIYLLTTAATFSAAMTTTAFVKQAAAGRAVILGEPPGDRMAFWAEGGRGCLPNYRLCVAYQTGKHDYANPCTDLDVCFWLNYAYPVRVQSLNPDETIAYTFADWRAGRDPVFERALALASAQARRVTQRQG